MINMITKMNGNVSERGKVQRNYVAKARTWEQTNPAVLLETLEKNMWFA